MRRTVTRLFMKSATVPIVMVGALGFYMMVASTAILTNLEHRERNKVRAR